MKLVIFDLDGTLVDSELLCNVALKHQLAESGFIYSATQLLERYRGGKLANIIASLNAELGTSLPVSFEADYREKVNTLFDEQLTANTGVEEVLNTLKVPVCIASSAPRGKILRALRVTGLAQYFDENTIFSAYDIDSWKPEPDLFLHAAQKMKVAPCDCIVVEDSVLGLQAAKSADMKRVYYAPEYPKQNILGATYITDMRQLLDCINSHANFDRSQ